MSEANTNQAVVESVEPVELVDIWPMIKECFKEHARAMTTEQWLDLDAYKEALGVAIDDTLDRIEELGVDIDEELNDKVCEDATNIFDNIRMLTVSMLREQTQRRIE